MTYKQILPMKTDETVKDQFGWLPVSVFKPQRREDWREIIGDDGDESARRSEDAKYLPGLRFSEFHPDLAEMIVKYWSLENDFIVDPFAGRATRGIVGLKLGRKYQGYEVATETFRKTKEKIEPLGGELHCLNGCLLGHTQNASADLVFTCPPYHRLEKYQSAPNQLSDIKDYGDFLTQIRVLARNVVRVLKPGKFLCWVVADWRDGKAFRTFHADSIQIFEGAGLKIHDIVIVHNNSPFAPLQAGKVAANRYTSKVHEYLLVFRKPDSSENISSKTVPSGNTISSKEWSDLLNVGVFCGVSLEQTNTLIKEKFGCRTRDLKPSQLEEATAVIRAASPSAQTPSEFD